MKCMNCNAEIPEDQLVCPVCGKEVQIVPDYNPLDDVLAAQVKGALDETISLDGKKIRKMDNRYATGRNATGRNAVGRNTTGRVPGNRTGRTDGRSPQAAEREQRKRQAERKRQLAKKKRRRMLMIIGAIFIIGILIGVACYQNSYTGKVKKGYRELEAKDYDSAIVEFGLAIKKNSKKPDAYTGLSKVYIAQDDLNQAEKIFTDAIELQPANADLYEAAIQFYIDTEQEAKVSILLEACEDDAVLSKVKDFLSEGPEFSLDESTEYDDVQELALTGSGESIYYTLDDTAPTTASTKYTAPIQISEGTTVVRAISVNKKGIPSLEVKKTYTVKLPIADAPAVTPSTGQYDDIQYIEVKVPDGYDAYYTTDGSIPSESAQKYTEPIEMPVGNTIFSVALIDKGGRMSDVTKRNYERLESE